MSKTNLAYGAEVLGTFFLSLAVLVAINSNAFIPEAVAILAGAVLGICVYTIGPISGCHINPAITLGLLTIKKIDLKNALGYILAQVFGAGLAIVFSSFLLGSDTLSEVLPFNIATFVAEAFGTFFFAFGIAAVVLGKAKEQMSGIV
ncbi:aquaporin, partial [Candidatus Kaiserbacteria bacterium CG_4_8_14_3_um_filter_38_9]